MAWLQRLDCVDCHEVKRRRHPQGPTISTNAAARFIVRSPTCGVSRSIPQRSVRRYDRVPALSIRHCPGAPIATA